MDYEEIECKRQFDYCLPYFERLKVDGDEDDREVIFVGHQIVSSFD